VIHFFWDRVLCTYRKPAGTSSPRTVPRERI
jgi:hypothetical protein